jgi:hypothetical protein
LIEWIFFLSLCSYYLDRIAEEINESLQDAGELLLMDLGKRFNISVDFLAEALEKRCGRILQAQIENDSIYTQEFVKRQEAKIRGALIAVTTPTPIYSIIKLHNLKEDLFSGIFCFID